MGANVNNDQKTIEKIPNVGDIIEYEGYEEFAIVEIAKNNATKEEKIKPNPSMNNHSGGSSIGKYESEHNIHKLKEKKSKEDNKDNNEESNSKFKSESKFYNNPEQNDEIKKENEFNKVAENNVNEDKNKNEEDVKQENNVENTNNLEHQEESKKIEEQNKDIKEENDNLKLEEKKEEKETDIKKEENKEDETKKEEKINNNENVNNENNIDNNIQENNTVENKNENQEKENINNDNENNNKNEEKKKENEGVKNKNEELGPKKIVLPNINTIISEKVLEEGAGNELLFMSNLNKIVHISIKERVKYSEKFCITTKDNFLIYETRENYIKVKKPLAIIPINSIKNVVLFKLTKKIINYDHFYIEFILDENNRNNVYNQVDTFYINDLDNNNNENKGDTALIMFKTEEKNLAKKWYVLLKYLTELKQKN